MMARPVTLTEPRGRRARLLAAARGLVLAWAVCAAAPRGAGRDVTFFHISDQHYDDEMEDPEMFVPTIRAMNELPGTAWPDAIGGGVDRPRGVIMTGDLTNDGTPGEWQAYAGQWGLTGHDGLLHYPVFEGAGNHDGAPSSAAPGDAGHVRRQIIERTRRRPGVTNVSANGLHYSWDWDDVHFVMLNEYAGPEDTARYPGNPAYRRKAQAYGTPAEQSLQFLRSDLASRVGRSGRPVVLLQHYGLGAFPLAPWGHEAGWWTEEHVMRLWEAIEGCNVIAILSGHDGSEAVIDWNGIPNRHMDDTERFGVYRIKGGRMHFAQRNSRTGRWEQAGEQPADINASLPPELVQGPYLVPGAAPGSMTVLWRTREDVPVTLKWGDDRFVYEDGSVEVRPHDPARLLYRHTITGLNPHLSTQFTLVIRGKHAPGMFYAGPGAPDRAKFLVLGGPAGAGHQQALHRTIYQKILRDPAFHSVILRPGPVVADPRSLAAWDEGFFSRAAAGNELRWVLTRVPLVVAPGGNPLMQQLFPGAGPVAGARALDYGPVHIAVVNADAGLDPGSPQERWLRAQLAGTTARFRVVMWNAVEAPSAEERLLEHLRPICDAHQVSLCLSGGTGTGRHEHGATTFLASGRPLAIEAAGAALRCEAFDADGTSIETFVIGVPRDAGAH